ncbi:voltage-gated potassium channel beta-2 subunit, partial [Reticulomyxa filosa]
GNIPEDSRRHQNNRMSSFYPEIEKEKLDKVKKLQPVELLFLFIADKLNTTLSVLAVAWCLKNKNVSVILLGAKRAEQLETCAAIKLQDKLTPDILKEIEKILNNKPIEDPALYGSFLRNPNARL